MGKRKRGKVDARAYYAFFDASRHQHGAKKKKNVKRACPCMPTPSRADIELNRPKGRERRAGVQLKLNILVLPK